MEIITSNDDVWSDEVEKHREEAFENGYEDAMDDVKELMKKIASEADASNRSPDLAWVMRELEVRIDNLLA